MDSNKTAAEKARRQLHKNAASNLEQVLAATPHKTPTVRPPASFYIAFTFRTYLLGSLMDSNKTAAEKARRQLHKNAASNLEQVLAATPHKTPTVRPPASYHENYTS